MTATTQGIPPDPGRKPGENGKVERVVGDLRIEIDPLLCVAFAECVKIAPEAFALNDDDVVMFVEPHRVERDRLLEACATCPVDAMLVWDARGNQLVP